MNLDQSIFLVAPQVALSFVVQIVDRERPSQWFDGYFSQTPIVVRLLRIFSISVLIVGERILAALEQRLRVLCATFLCQYHALARILTTFLFCFAQISNYVGKFVLVLSIRPVLPFLARLDSKLLNNLSNRSESRSELITSVLFTVSVEDCSDVVNEDEDEDEDDQAGFVIVLDESVVNEDSLIRRNVGKYLLNQHPSHLKELSIYINICARNLNKKAPLVFHLLYQVKLIGFEFFLCLQEVTSRRLT
ncbi:hypothetical protein BpHYR1_039772 [Brachionus plicatilis]|uniref:Uncharacterized protein n=1 Tax=Brachionus plicatilis TaxID=10195 RepID=A0A3M7SKW2_BRAPC|nr:hypothetical protein BpHYR1_039772 [Brachionus plicatilis]